MMRTILLIAALSALLAGCSPRAMYDAGRAWRTSLCKGTDDEVECRRRATRPYAETVGID